MSLPPAVTSAVSQMLAVCSLFVARLTHAAVGIEHLVQGVGVVWVTVAESLPATAQRAVHTHRVTTQLVGNLKVGYL